MDEVATMRRAVEVAGKVVDNIGPAQLGLPTPCSAWTVRDVLNHLAAGANVFARCVRDGAITDADLSAIITTDALDHDFQVSYHRAMDAAVEAFAAPGVMDRLVHVPIGELPARMAANIAVVEVMTHAWDLATATGQPTDLDPETCGFAYRAALVLLSDDMRMTGRFGPAVVVGDDRALPDRLAALTGRTP